MRSQRRKPRRPPPERDATELILEEKDGVWVEVGRKPKPVEPQLPERRDELAELLRDVHRDLVRLAGKNRWARISVDIGLAGVTGLVKFWRKRRTDGNP